MTALYVESTFPRTWPIFHLFFVLLFFLYRDCTYFLLIVFLDIFLVLLLLYGVFYFFIFFTWLLLILYFNFISCHLAWFIICSYFSSDSHGFSQYRLYHLRHWGQAARIPSQLCHILAVWSHFGLYALVSSSVKCDITIPPR